MRKKRFLFLLLSALVYGGSAFADGETTEEETPTPPVTSLSIDDYGKLKDAVTSIKNVASLQKEIADLQKKVDAAETALNNATQYVYSTEKVSDVHNAISSFTKTVTSTKAVEDKTKISYAIGITKETETNWDTGDETEINKYTFYITIPSVSGKISKEENTSRGITEWKTVQADEVYRIKTSGTTQEKQSIAFNLKEDGKVVFPTQLVIVYLEKNIGEVSNTIETALPDKCGAIYLPALLNACYSYSLNILNSEDNYSGLKQVKVQTTDGDGNLLYEDDGTPIYETLDYRAKKAAYETAVTNLENKEDELGDYATITTLNITEDITVTDDKLSTETWPANYTINGNGKKIINNTKKPLFAENKGNIYNWLSLGESIAKDNTGRVRDCIVKYSGGYRTYDDDAVKREFTELEDAVYSLRSIYGMDFTNNKSVDIVTDDNKLYQLQYANATNKNVYKFKANININDEKFVYDTKKAATNKVSSLSRENAVVYVDDADAETKVAGFTNVAVKTGSNEDGTAVYVCAEAKLTEGTTSPEFYVPFDFTATTLAYERTIERDLVSVCLPFALTEEVLKNISTTTGLEVNAYRFKEVDADKDVMWFNHLTAVDANKPCILSFKDGDKAAAPNSKIFNNLAEVSFGKTVGADLSSLSTNTSEKRFFGNYRPNQTYGNLVSQASDKGATGSAIYGIQKGKLVKMAATSRMNAFRSFVVWTEDLTKPSSNAPVFRVGLLDKDGNEDIVTGIEAVNTANNNTNSDFQAVGGHNVIEITTGKACDVKVYTLNGALAKTARIEAGTTTLPMNAGMYVVNKTKVIVK